MDFKREKPSWAKGLKRRDLYFEGLIDSGDLESILEDHKRSTITSFGTRTSSNVTVPQVAIKSEKTHYQKQRSRYVTVPYTVQVI